MTRFSTIYLKCSSPLDSCEITLVSFSSEFPDPSSLSPLSPCSSKYRYFLGCCPQHLLTVLAFLGVSTPPWLQAPPNACLRCTMSSAAANTPAPLSTAELHLGISSTLKIRISANLTSHIQSCFSSWRSRQWYQYQVICPGQKSENSS